MSTSRPKPVAKSEDGKRRANTAEDTFQRLIETLVTGEEVVPGEPLREARMAREWGVSRTPMREAVRRAAEAGFLILRRNQAPLVRVFSAHDADCLYQVRELMELLALEQAWDHLPPDLVDELREMATAASPGEAPDWIERCLALDEALHNAWFDHCQNPWLTRFLHHIRSLIRAFQRVMARDVDLVKQSYHEHCGIIEVLGSPERQTGCDRLREHIRNSEAAVRLRLEQKASGEPGYPPFTPQ